jgi:hypothetical protein
MTLNSNLILKYRGGTRNNDLTNTTNLEFFEMTTKSKSKYYDTDGLISFLLKHKNKITVLNSINIDSLNSKYNDLKELTENMEKQNAFVSIICIREARLNENTDTDHLQLNNYDLITQPLTKHCSTKGGLACYILNCIQIKIKINSTISAHGKA